MGQPIPGLGEWARKHNLTAGSIAKMLDGKVNGESTVRKWLKGGGIRDIDDIVPALKAKLSRTAALRDLEELLDPVPPSDTPNDQPSGEQSQLNISSATLERQMALYLRLEGLRSDVLAKSEAREKNRRILQETRATLEEVRKNIDFDNEALWDDLVPSYMEISKLMRDHHDLLEPSTREHFSALIGFIDVWRRAERRALGADAIQAHQHTEEKLKPLYADFERHGSRLETLFGRDRGHLSEYVRQALLQDADVVLKSELLHQQIVKAQEPFENHPHHSGYAAELAKAYLSGLKYLLERAFDHDYNKELGSPQRKRLALRLVEDMFAEKLLEHTRQTSSSLIFKAETTAANWKRLVQELELHLVGSCD